MENQEGFERLVPYRTEKELKEATKWYNTVDCKKTIDRETIEMILYNGVTSSPAMMYFSGSFASIQIFLPPCKEPAVS